MTSRVITQQDVLPNGFPGYIANSWYTPGGVSLFIAGSAPGNGSIRLIPGLILQKCTLSALGVRISAASAGGNVQAAIYANNPAAGRPTGNALASTASMSTASAAAVSAAVSVQLTPGLYWFGVCHDNATSSCIAPSNSQGLPTSLIGSATQANILGASGAALVGVSVSGTFNTWPDMTSASFNESNGSSAFGIVEFKVGSIP